jgi:hypothetical protein
VATSDSNVDEGIMNGSNGEKIEGQKRGYWDIVMPLATKRLSTPTSTVPAGGSQAVPLTYLILWTTMLAILAIVEVVRQISCWVMNTSE